MSKYHHIGGSHELVTGAEIGDPEWRLCTQQVPCENHLELFNQGGGNTRFDVVNEVHLSSTIENLALLLNSTEKD